MTDQDAFGDETSASLTGLGKGIRNALLIEFVIGLIVWLVWRIAT
jgi:hypothetical protein